MDFEGRARIRSHLDIAPLIDVVFLLLVFFMLTTTFMIPEAVELELPQSQTGDPRDASPITVTVEPDGRVTLNGRPLALDELKTALQPLLAQPESSITLKSDATTEVRLLLQVMDEIRAAGGEHISLATQRQ